MDLFTITLLCGLFASAVGRIGSRIVGGSVAAIGELSWQGSLQLRIGSSWRHHCGCVLYSSNKALTAAHCLTSSFTNYRVVFGKVNLDIEEVTEQESPLDSYIINPQYNSHVSGVPHDIAVLRLSTPMATSSAVAPIALPTTNPPSFTGGNCVISGWGNLGNGMYTNMLQRVNMTVIVNNDCSNHFIGEPNSDIYSGHICLLRSGATSCDGDSGGPVVCDNLLAGIASRYRPDCSDLYPSVNTRVSDYTAWISSQ